MNSNRFILNDTMISLHLAFINLSHINATRKVGNKKAVCLHDKNKEQRKVAGTQKKHDKIILKTEYSSDDPEAVDKH